MKLDLDLARNIMLAAEAAPAGETIYKSKLLPLCPNEDELASHVEHLVKVKYLDATVHTRQQRNAPPNIVIRGLLPPGYEFIRLTKQASTWKKAKDFAAKYGPSIAVPLVVEFIKGLAKGHTSP